MLAWRPGKSLCIHPFKQQHLHYFMWVVVGGIWDHSVNLKMSIDILKTVRKTGGRSLPRSFQFSFLSLRCLFSIFLSYKTLISAHKVFLMWGPGSVWEGSSLQVASRRVALPRFQTCFYLIFQRGSRRSTSGGLFNSQTIWKPKERYFWALWCRLAAKRYILIAVVLLPPESIYIYKDKEGCILLSMILYHYCVHGRLGCSAIARDPFFSVLEEIYYENTEDKTHHIFYVLHSLWLLKTELIHCCLWIFNWLLLIN